MYKHVNSKGKEYFLNVQSVNGTKRKVFFFTKKRRPESESDMPLGYSVKEGGNGLPMIKRMA